MPTQVQLRRGTTTQVNSFTGAAGELAIDITKNTIVVQDGVTAGGFPLARASDLSNNVTIQSGVDSTQNTNISLAYTQANTANILAQAAYNQANSANVLAQAAFNKANTATSTGKTVALAMIFGF